MIHAQEVARVSQDRATATDKALNMADEKIATFEAVKRQEMEENMVKVNTEAVSDMPDMHAIYGHAL